MWSVSAIPRHSFISWLAFRNRLATGGRKLHWGYLGTTACVFCRGCQESRNRSFFHCFFTRRVWKELLKCCLVRNPIIVWDEIVNWGIKTAEAEASVLPCVGFALWAAIYHVWLERNARLHGGQFTSKDNIVLAIRLEVGARMLAKGNYCNSVLNRVLYYN